MRADDDTVLVEVRDDGTWRRGSAGSGLTGMRERAHLVHGTLTVQHGGNGTRGTSVTLLMPRQEVET
jgi:two-component system sensor histidine kinase UhpB